MSSTEIVPRRGKSKRRVFDSEFRIKVLEYLDRGGDFEQCRRDFELTRGDILKIVQGRTARVQGRASELVGGINEQAVRTRLWDRAMIAAEDSLDPIERVIEKSTLLRQPRGLEFLATVAMHTKNRGQNATKVLEGIGVFRRGGDDIPRDIPRRPLFNLPANAHVAVKFELTTGESNGSSDSRTIEAERIDSEDPTTA